MPVSPYRPSHSERHLLTALLAVSMQACLVCPSIAATPEVTPACEQMADAAAAEFAARIDAALKSKHPDHVTRLFTADAAIKGFGSPLVRADYASIRDYFLYFLQFEPTLTYENRRIETGCNFAIDSGTYVWSLKPRDAEAPTQYPVPARYRMTMEKVGSTWLISELIEEPKGADAAQSAAMFALPALQPMRAADAIATTVPAVAGYLKRTTDEAARGDAAVISKAVRPASKAAQPSDSVPPANEDKTAAYQRWFESGR